MFALASSFRTAVRRQSQRLPAAATRASSTSFPQYDHANTVPATLTALSEQLLDLAEQEEALKAATEDNDGILDTTPNLDGRKDYPILKGFYVGQFTQPMRFSRAEYTKVRLGHKRFRLGPDAATSKELDIFHQLGLDPLKESQNTALLSHFVTRMGKIKGRSETNLTWKNQRRMGKAIRRAKMMGLIPVLSRRPLFLQSDSRIG